MTDTTTAEGAAAVTGFIRTARYVEWLANIVPVLKKTGALRICIDYRAAKHELVSFMDGHAGYNQIFIAEEDVHKTAFRCPGAIGTYEWAFARMRAHGLKMNPKERKAGNFLGFLVHQRGIEVDKNKATAIMAAPPPKTKRELQSFLGKVNFLRRFISNLARKIRPLTPLLKLKDAEQFVWEAEHQAALDDIKKYLS
ncbi:unnamed protein product [Prunus brigantina]